MYFGFDEEQRLMQKSMRELLDRECSTTLVRAAWSNPSGRVAGLWSKLAELGALSLRLPATRGGLGLTELELVLVLEEAGRAALPEPLAETAGVGAPLLCELSDQAFAEPWLERIARGEAVVSLELEPWPYASHANSADILLIAREQELFLLAREQVELLPQPSVDGARRLYRTSWDERAAVRLLQGEAAGRALGLARDRAALSAAAELVGLAARMLDMSVEYAQARMQFGRPIGSFQAVQHQLANALLKLEFARPLLYRAAYSLSIFDHDHTLHVSMAKAAASDAALFVSRTALQVHGAIGYSYEYPLHLYMKRAWALAAAYGAASWHRARCAARILGPIDTENAGVRNAHEETTDVRSVYR